MFIRLGIGWVLIGAFMMLPPTTEAMNICGAMIFTVGGAMFLHGMHQRDVKENEDKDRRE